MKETPQLITEFHEPVATNKIDREFSSEKARFVWSWWQKSGGCLDDHSIEPLFNHLTLCQAILPNDNSCPPFIFVGEHSLIAEYFGQDFAIDARSHTVTPDTDLEKIARLGYESARDKQPFASIISTNVSSRWKPSGLLYERLLFPIRVKQGIHMIGCFAEPINSHC